MQTEHKAYFDALEQHPMELVGQEVPAIGREGTMRLGSVAEAREWQDAIKHVLVREVRSRASKAMDENRDFLTTVHASISLFQDNPDLVPGAAGFDRELADRLVKLVEPYEVRVEGKLQGYTIPVQPIVNQLRAQVVQERAAAASSAAAAGGDSTTPPAATATKTATKTAATPPAEQPQAGIVSKAGGGGDAAEDFSTLFGTIGLPNLQI